MKQHKKTTSSRSHRLFQKLRWRWHNGLMVFLLVLMVTLFFAARVPVAAANLPVTGLNSRGTLPQSGQLAKPTVRQSSIECSANPFGNVHDLFSENEVFVSTTATLGFVPNVTGVLMDVTSNSHHTFLGEEWWHYETTNPIGFDLVTHDVTGADLDGDGESEFIQTFTNGSGEWYLAYHSDFTGGNSPYYKISSRLYNPVVTVSGHISSTNSFQEQAVLAGVDQLSGKVNVLLWDGSNYNGWIQNKGRWSSTAGGRINSSLLDITVGDFDGDTDDDIAVLMKHNNGEMELVVLAYDPNHHVETDTNNVEFYLKPVANIEFNPQIPSSISVLAGRLNADFRDDIVVVFNDINADDQSIHLFAFELDALNGVLNHLTSYNENITYASGHFDMAAGMGNIDDDPLRDEIALAYPADDGFHIQVLGAQGLDTASPNLDTLYDWSTSAEAYDDAVEYLSLDVGDLTNDGQDEIVAAFHNDYNQLEVIYLDQDNLTQNTLTHATDMDPNGLNTPTAIAMGDANNDSIRAVYSGDCREVREDNLNTVVYRPPIWQNIMAEDLFDLFGYIGNSTGQGSSVEEQLGSERSTATSGYVGVGIEAEYGVASFEASARVTMAEEYSQGSAQGTEQSSSETISIEESNVWNFATGDESTYYCYAYDILQNGTVVADSSSVRSCELVNSEPTSGALFQRDAATVIRDTSVNKALEWVPTTRDWESLGLFCTGCSTSQSSTDSVGTADKAVDGMLNGEINSMTATNAENYPWWELDLGQTEDITKIRIWHNDLDACQPNDCAEQLKDFYVFVSDTPFSPTDTPTDLLADSNINSYSFANISEPLSTTVGTDFPAGRVTTFLTWEAITSTVRPIEGQYIRVQINRINAELNLAEVQVFGLDHVEPNRYPLAVRPAGVEYFEVQLFDPTEGINKWVQVRGELLWDGRKNNGDPVTLPVEEGYTTRSWSRINDQAQSSFTSRTISEQKSVGFEFELSAGAIVQAQGGFGMEWSTGVFTETTHRTTWTESFGIGGSVKGFPAGNPGDVILWYEQCEYNIRPYYYQLTEESSFGYQTTHTVLDYVVTDRLNRQDDLAPCLLGHPESATPSAGNDEVGGTTGGDILVHPLLNDAGNANLRITSVGNSTNRSATFTDRTTGNTPNGSATFTDRTITYTPNAGFVGQDTFSYTISDGVTESTATITVNVDPILVFLPMVIR